MAEYAKKKNDELAALCKERGLAHTGKKADLVKRLEEHDAAGVAPAKTAAPEDEIDWDEPAAETAKAANAKPTAAPTSETKPSAPAPSEQSATATAPDGGQDAPSATKVEESTESKDFSSGLADRTLDEEIEKRKARARKFGLPENSDEIKALERAKRFGTGQIPGMLNKALSTERKRGRETDGDGSLRKRSRARTGRGRAEPEAGTRQTNGRRGGGGDSEAKGSGVPAWMSEADKKKAEARKARFATS